MIELLKKPVGMLTIAEMRQIEHALNGQPAVGHSVTLADAFGLTMPSVVTISLEDSPEFIEGAAAAMDAATKDSQSNPKPAVGRQSRANLAAQSRGKE